MKPIHIKLYQFIDVQCLMKRSVIADFMGHSLSVLLTLYKCNFVGTGAVVLFHVLTLYMHHCNSPSLIQMVACHRLEPVTEPMVANC